MPRQRTVIPRSAWPLLLVLCVVGGARAAGPAREHWAFRPIADPPPPQVRDLDWCRSPLDAFVLARLEAAGLSPSPPADARTLIRRVTFDLTGLPPTPEEVEAFVNDHRPDAYERLVDRLLASPAYGERWGRHWLDVARYADTKDLVLLFGPDRIRPYAYTYRDYVVRAFNEDLPYDQFIHDQLAADKVAPKGERWRLAAMGFLTLGRLFDNNPPDVYDDQIDTVTRGLLGLTVSCARCHDHKYDDIPTADYYSLYGVFAGSERPLDLPLIAEPQRTPEYEKFAKESAAKREALRKHTDTQYAQLTETARLRVGDYLVQVATQPPDPLETGIFFLSLSPGDLRPQIVARWRRYLRRHGRSGDPVFGLWGELMDLPDDSYPERAKKVLARWDDVPAGTGRDQVNPLVRAGLRVAKITSRADVARAYGAVFKKVYEDSRKPAGSVPAGEKEVRGQLLAILTTPAGPVYFPRRHAYLYMDRVPRGTYSGLRKELDKLAVLSPAAPPRAMVLADSPQLENPRVFVRGNPLRPGEVVPRRFLRLLSPGDREPFTDGSGRLGLARAITAPDNPLTARVIVNRVWMHHFGNPLVDTPSDFGVRSSPPTHPALLDHLATALQRDGWSLKALHRRIVLSSAYRQASGLERQSRKRRKIDPEDRLLWRYPRRRLGLEAMRDAMLAVSGRLERKVGGRAVDLVGDAKNRRRTLYGLVDRQDLPGLYRAFDFASPDQTAARRPQTTVPQQALFALNSPFVLEQARALAGLVAGEKDSRAKVQALYRRVLLREPDEGEVELALRFVKSAEGLPLGPWEQYAQVLLISNEFHFVD
jgi:hypothetical protein